MISISNTIYNIYKSVRSSPGLWILKCRLSSTVHKHGMNGWWPVADQKMPEQKNFVRIEMRYNVYTLNYGEKIADPGVDHTELSEREVPSIWHRYRTVFSFLFVYASIFLIN